MGVVPVGELPKVAKGVVFKNTPPKVAPMNLVNLLNDVSKILAAAYKGETGLPGAEKIEGTSISVSADWKGENKWQLKWSATNSLPRDGMPDGGMIVDLEQFVAAMTQVNEMLGTQLMSGLSANFVDHVWETEPGAAGEDGQPRGVTVVLNCATAPGVGLDKAGVPYWQAA
jgi:hypothetical protein